MKTRMTIEERMCSTKRRFASAELCQVSIYHDRFSTKRSFVPLRAYHCPFCGAWHKTKNHAKESARELAIAKYWQEMGEAWERMELVIRNLAHETVSKNPPVETCRAGCGRCAIERAWVVMKRVQRDFVKEPEFLVLVSGAAGAAESGIAGGAQ